MNLEQLRKQAKELATARAGKRGPSRGSATQPRLASRAVRARARARFRELAEAEGVRRAPGAEQPFHTDLDYYEGRADGIATVNGVSVAEARRDLARRHGFASWDALAAHVEALRGGERAADAVRARLPGGRGRRHASGCVELARRASRARPAARDERQRPARDGRRPRARPAAARARRRPEPRQRLRLDEAPPGRLLERPRARPADARRRRRGSTSRPRRRRHAARSRRCSGATARSSPLLGLEPGNLRVAAGLGLPRADRRACRHARAGRAPRLLPAARRLPRLAALRRSAGGARRGARLGGEEPTGSRRCRCSSSSARGSTPTRTAAPR